MYGSACLPKRQLSDSQSQPGSKEFECGGTNRAAGGWVSLPLSPARAPSKPSSSQKKDSPPITEDLRGKFYEHYRKEAEEYDKEFLKKNDEDLNTTLIFVCRAHRASGRVLTRVIGRSVFCRNLCLYYRGQLRTEV